MACLTNCSTLIALGVFSISAIIIIGFLATGIYAAHSQERHHDTGGLNQGAAQGVNVIGSQINPTVGISSPDQSFTNSLTTPNKIVMLVFDDNRKGNTTYAKPILDKYGFKASFFVIYNHTTDKGAMNWNDIADMKKDGMDIESHTMTHPDLSTLSQKQLEFEIGG